jgi:Domain of unknown function (DUF6268)
MGRIQTSTQRCNSSAPQRVTVGLMLRLPCIRLLAGLLLSVPSIYASGPEGLNLIDPALIGFGPPGFSTVATISESMNFDGGGGAIDFTDGRFLLPAWGKRLDSGTVYGVSVGYDWANFDAGDWLGLGKSTLQSLELQFTAAHFPKGDTGWLGIALITPGLGSDFNQISADDFSLRGIAVVGYQFNPKVALALAGYANSSIGEVIAYPGIGLIWRPSDAWMFQLTPPIMGIGWSPNKAWMISLSAYPSGGQWDVDGEGTDGRIEAISLSLFRAGLGIERRIGKHFRIVAQAGVNFGGDIEIRDQNQVVLAQRDLEPALFGLLGAAYAF